MATLTDVYEIDPRAVERARRLEFAKRQLRNGATRREAVRRLRDSFAVSQPTAWRVVDAAHDLAGPLTVAEKVQPMKGGRT